MVDVVSVFMKLKINFRKNTKIYTKRPRKMGRFFCFKVKIEFKKSPSTEFGMTNK